MIKVGDIVKTKDKEGKAILPAVVTKVYMSAKSYNDTTLVVSSVDVLFSDGRFGNRSIKKVEGTLRHIDMQSVLESIR